MGILGGEIAKDLDDDDGDDDDDDDDDGDGDDDDDNDGDDSNLTRWEELAENLAKDPTVEECRQRCQRH